MSPDALYCRLCTTVLRKWASRVRTALCRHNAGLLMSVLFRCLRLLTCSLFRASVSIALCHKHAAPDNFFIRLLPLSYYGSWRCPVSTASLPRQQFVAVPLTTTTTTTSTTTGVMVHTRPGKPRIILLVLKNLEHLELSLNCT